MKKLVVALSMCFVSTAFAAQPEWIKYHENDDTINFHDIANISQGRKDVVSIWRKITLKSNKETFDELVLQSEVNCKTNTLKDSYGFGFKNGKMIHEARMGVDRPVIPGSAAELLVQVTCAIFAADTGRK